MSFVIKECYIIDDRRSDFCLRDQIIAFFKISLWPPDKIRYDQTYKTKKGRQSPCNKNNDSALGFIHEKHTGNACGEFTGH